MKQIALLSASLGVMFVYMSPAMPAHAQFWVASNGSGTACTRAAPCNSFQAAHDAAPAEAMVKCLDSFDAVSGGGNGNLVINRSITIDCTGTNSSMWAGNLPAVSFSTGGNVVTLRGLAIDGLGSSGKFGIDLTNNNELHVEHCRIANWQGSGNTNPTAAGIRVVASVLAIAKLYVSDCLFENNGKPTTGGGIIVQASGTGGQFPLGSAARIALNRVQLVNNTHGIVADGTTGIGSIVVEMRDSIVSGNAGNGIAAMSQSGAASAGIVVHRTSVVGNAGSGILAQGAGALVHLGTSSVVGNGAGLNPASGGQIFSYQNNEASVNATDGAPTGMLTPK
jgi:hypothetical protein